MSFGRIWKVQSGQKGLQCFPKPNITQDFASKNIKAKFQINSAMRLNFDLIALHTMHMKPWGWFYSYLECLQENFQASQMYKWEVPKESIIYHEVSHFYHIKYFYILLTALVPTWLKTWLLQYVHNYYFLKNEYWTQEGLPTYLIEMRIKFA